MGLFSKQNSQPQQHRLADDIEPSIKWLIVAMASSDYHLDLTIESLKEIDRFFDEQNTPNGILSKNKGSILFAMGCYVGEVIIRNFGGVWLTDDSDPQGEINIAVKTDNGSIMFPVQRCIKRFQNGAEDSIYAYVYVLKAKS